MKFAMNLLEAVHDYNDLWFVRCSFFSDWRCLALQYVVTEGKEDA